MTERSRIRAVWVLVLALTTPLPISYPAPKVRRKRHTQCVPLSHRLKHPTDTTRPTNRDSNKGESMPQTKKSKFTSTGCGKFTTDDVITTTQNATRNGPMPALALFASRSLYVERGRGQLISANIFPAGVFFLLFPSASSWIALERDVIHAKPICSATKIENPDACAQLQLSISARNSANFQELEASMSRRIDVWAFPIHAIGRAPQCPSGEKCCVCPLSGNAGLTRSLTRSLALPQNNKDNPGGWPRPPFLCPRAIVSLQLPIDMPVPVCQFHTFINPPTNRKNFIGESAEPLRSCARSPVRRTSVSTL